MRKSLRVLMCVLSMVCLAPAVSPAVAAVGDPLTVRVSVTQAGLEANGGSSNPSVSADGRYVAFTSNASNLVPDDSIGYDTFVYDRQTGHLTRIAGITGAEISGDGRYLAFSSGRTDLVAGDTNGFDDVFLMEWQTGQTRLVSVASGGAQGNARSWGASVSADGNQVAFISEATNLAPLSGSAADVSASATGLWRIYVRDLSTSQTTLASRTSSGTPANQDSYHPTISANGQYVSFTSEADNLPGTGIILYSNVPNAYLHDRASGTTLLVSRKPDGYRSADALASSWNGAISADGRYVAFASEASDLVTGDTNAKADTFVFDRVTLTVARISLGTGGVQPNDSSAPLAMSAAGNLVLFRSTATNLVAGDANGVQDLFVRDIGAGNTTRVSVGSDGREANKAIQGDGFSADGRYVTFYTGADNLAYCDRNGTDDVFLHDRQGSAQPWPTVKTLALTLPSGPMPADGTTKADISVLVTDTQGKPMGCGTVAFSLSPSLGWLSSTTATTALDGRATVQYTVPWPSDLGTNTSVTVTATCGAASQSGTITFATTCVRVEDDSGQPVSGAEVWRNGSLAGTTGTDGRLCTIINAGDALVAREQVQQQPAVKAGHDGWSFRVYRTSIDIPTAAEPTPFVVTNTSQEQVLTVLPSNPLVAFNIVASLEWDARPGYLADIASAFQQASSYLYDATDGQVLFGQVTIYDNGYHFADADYQFRANNQEWPRASVRGLSAGSAEHVYLGRYWNGSAAYFGNWSQANGYRTMIHEFGHYGLWLYDSYVGYLIESQKWFKSDTFCTDNSIRSNNAFATNATIMDYAYNSSEFAARGVPGLWNEANCTVTRQWHMHAESDWETLSRCFTGSSYRLRTPIDRASVVAGPTTLVVPAWAGTPTIVSANTGICAADPVLTMTLWPFDSPAANTRVYLERADGTVIDQGKTDTIGEIAILGAANGDTVHSYNWQDNGLRVRTQTISCAVSAAALDAGLAPQAVESMSLEPAPFELDVSVDGIGATEAKVLVVTSVALAGAPTVLLHQTGGAAVAVAMAPGAAGAYEGIATLSAALPLSGTVDVTATDTSAGTLRYMAPFALQAVDAAAETIALSADGLAELFLPPGALPDGALVSIGSAPDTPAPDGLVVVSGPYEVSASTALTGGANLSLTAAGGGPASHADLSTAQVYRREGGVWVPVETTVSVLHRYAAAPVDSLGTYAVLAEVQWRAYLPVAFHRGR